MGYFPTWWNLHDFLRRRGNQLFKFLWIVICELWFLVPTVRASYRMAFNSWYLTLQFKISCYFRINVLHIYVMTIFMFLFEFELNSHDIEWFMLQYSVPMSKNLQGAFLFKYALYLHRDRPFLAKSVFVFNSCRVQNAYRNTTYYIQDSSSFNNS